MWDLRKIWQLKQGATINDEHELPVSIGQRSEETVKYNFGQIKNWVLAFVQVYVGNITQGPQGPVGMPGQQGQAGPQGEKGERGDVGPQGVRGDVGPQGPVGIQGITGQKGDKGDTGEQGLQGIQGEQGPAGANGINGANGRGIDKWVANQAVAKAGLVQYDKLFYESLVDDNITVPGSDASKWQLVGGVNGGGPPPDSKKYRSEVFVIGVNELFTLKTTAGVLNTLSGSDELENIMVKVGASGTYAPFSIAIPYPANSKIYFTWNYVSQITVSGNLIWEGTDN